MFYFIRLKGYSLYGQLVLEWNPLGLLLWALSSLYGRGSGSIMNLIWYQSPRLRDLGLVNHLGHISASWVRR
jgi:hypothetical protein